MSRLSYGTKIVYIGLQIAVLMVGTLLVLAFVNHRENNSEEICRDITSKWGRPLWIKGPVVNDTTKNGYELEPFRYSCDVNVTTESLHRGIYEVQVFTADVAIKGTYRINEVVGDVDSLTFRLDTEQRDVTGIKPLVIEGKEYEWSNDGNQFYAKVPRAGLPDIVEISTSFTANGSESVDVFRFGGGSEVSINGVAPDPSFKGETLPTSREVQRGRFKATWSATGDNVRDSDRWGYVGSRFLVTMDLYRKVNRALTYSFFVILLTYLALFVTELFRKQRVPLFNYFLIGAALVIFYTLLLSFSELVGFGWSYLIASAMTVLMVSLYAWRIFRNRMVGFIMLALLAAIYGACYMMLISSNYALLIGSLTLFCTVAVLMYVTIRPTPLQKPDEI